MRIIRFMLAFLIRGLLVAGLFLVLDPSPHAERVRFWERVGNEFAQMGDLDSAARAYANMGSGEELHNQSLERLLSLSMENEQWDTATAYLFALADQVGWANSLRSQYALLLDAQGFQAAVVAFNRWEMASADSDPGALRQIARQYLAEQNWIEAQRSFEILLETVPEDGEANYYLGLIHLASDTTRAAMHLSVAANGASWQDQAAVALSAVRAVQNIDVSSAQTYLGVMLVGLDEWGLAERSLSVALAANAVNPVGRAYLGYVKDRLGRDGLPDLETALSMGPDNGVVYFLLGQHWSLAGDDSAAYEAYSQAYWLDPSNPAYAAEVGLAKQRIGDLEGAESWLRVAVELDPGEERWQALLAVFYADMRYDLEGTAITFIEDAAAVFPNNADIVASLGWAKHVLGDTQNALAVLNRAVFLDASNVRTRYYFGAVLESLGDVAAAADSFLFVRDTAPSSSRYGVLADRALRRLGY